MDRIADPMQERAAHAARLLRALGNPSRLLILCRLFKGGEMSAGALAEELGLGLSALSQHLARMRAEGLVSQRRQARQLFYRLAEDASAQLPAVLAGICGEGTAAAGDGMNGGGASPMGTILGLALSSAGATAGGPSGQAPLIPSAGRVYEVPQAAYPPDPHATYRVVFGLTAAAPDPGRVHPGLERVARAINLYGSAGVPLDHLHVVTLVSGGATAVALDDATFRKQFGVANPNLHVIAALRGAGGDVAVCGQAVAGQGYAYEAVDDHVTIALSSLTTLIELQQKGYALVPL